jgi:hypothetical protein
VSKTYIIVDDGTIIKGRVLATGDTIKLTEQEARRLRHDGIPLIDPEVEGKYGHLNEMPKGRPALAKPGDPLVTGKGAIIEPPKEPTQLPKSVSQTVKAEDYRPLKRTSLKDLPAPVNIMKAVSVIFTLTILGLGDREIADAANISVEEVIWIRQHTAYADVFDTMVNEFVNANSALLQGRIAAFSHMALDTMAEIAANGKQEANKVNASKDILDRAGTNPRDKVPNQKAGLSGLRIVISEKAKDVHVSVDIGD